MRKLILCLAGLLALSANARRIVTTLNDGWQFSHVNDGQPLQWQDVRIPHDWAIYGPFNRANDLQDVAVEQNGENEKSLKTGRTGGLPFVGKGIYKTTFNVPDTTGRNITLLFDGAMSNPVIKVNGKEVGRWAYGYNSFYCDATNAVRPGENELVVELENKPQSSRWYPGAGLYRNVHLIDTSKAHVPVWGVNVTTPEVTIEKAKVVIKYGLEGINSDDSILIETRISDANGVVAEGSCKSSEIQLEVPNPSLWSPEKPTLYTAETILSVNGKQVDSLSTRFGVRTLEFRPSEGFFLNGKLTKFRGVCNHHDLGPLGAAVNRSALRHQLEMLQDMGVNAVRTSHNMPAPELVELCDEMGIMLMVEAFDDWGYRPKSPNGYGSVFNEWYERDITNMVRHYRNNPSVVMWSIGNEVPSQWSPEGIKELTQLQNLVHELDSTRLVTCGMDQIRAVLHNGFAAALDIPSFNYKPQFYQQIYDKLPQKLLIGSESASTVSSRGAYHFPAKFGGDHNEVRHPDGQSSSYDVETCSWSNTPDIDFLMDEKPWVLGQFVWTGFDYLGEPSPYDTNAWPNHSSVFGIIDLASLPKDRYFLYRSQWNRESPTLHVLPHWNWPGREGEVTPVFVYTSYPSAELFINGKSQGLRQKNDSTVQNRYRLMWNETRYEPGELKVVAYDSLGSVAAQKIIRTPGKPHHLVATSSRKTLDADGEDLAYITIQVADKEGNLIPTDSRNVTFHVRGAGTFEATANGDPRSLSSFQNPAIELFSGAATAIVRSAKSPGKLIFEVNSPGLKSAKLVIHVKAKP